MAKAEPYLITDYKDKRYLFIKSKGGVNLYKDFEEENIIITDKDHNVIFHINAWCAQNEPWLSVYRLDDEAEDED